MNSTNLIGQVFERLTVISKAVPPVTNRQNKSYWLCRCTCGSTKLVSASNLKTKQVKSCGCLRNENTKALKYSHGKTGTKVYRAWKSMKSRCYNKHDTEYHNYGGRGITICKEWLNFNIFYADMGDLPFKGAQLGRINNEGIYKKANCQWESATTQARNKRTNKILEFKGRTQCLVDWSKELNINKGTLATRLKLGWSTEKALTTPVTR